LNQSPEARAAVALGCRPLASAKARDKPAFSDEDDESGGELEKEPPLSSSHTPAASVAAAPCSRSAWTSDLTGAVNPSNILHWNYPMGPKQHRYSTPTARGLRKLSCERGAYWRRTRRTFSSLSLPPQRWAFCTLPQMFQPRKGLQTGPPHQSVELQG
jgi:hypothetical protein